jgi:hypothetical protein
VVASRSALASVSSPTSGMSRYLAEAGREGWFVFSSTNLSAQVSADTAQGIYVAPSGATSGVSGAWVRKYEGAIEAHWFGLTEGDASGANAAANNSVWTGIKSLLTQLANNAGTNVQAVPILQYGDGTFEFSATHDYNFGTIICRGKGGADAASGARTRLKFYSCTGIRVQSADTSGASTKDGVLHQSGQQSLFEDMSLVGNFAGTEAEFHGLHARAPVRWRNLFVYGFAGDGFRLEGDSAGSLGGGTNGSVTFGGGASFCRNGLYAVGNDANASTFVGLNCHENRQWGMWDSSFLGNTFDGGHTATNGYPISGTPPSQVFYTGHVYFVITGQEAGASTNHPSGTTADNTWWAYRSDAASADPAFYPTWVSGTTYRSGGAVHADNVNATALFKGVYAEGDQGKGQVAQRCMIIGGQLSRWRYGGSDPTNQSPTITAESGAIRIPGPFSADGNITANQDGTALGGIRLTRGGANGYLESFNPAGTRQWYGGFLNGSALQFAAEGTADHFEFLSRVHISDGRLTLTEIAAASVVTPAAATQTLFIDSADHKLKRKDSSGTTTIIN